MKPSPSDTTPQHTADREHDARRRDDDQDGGARAPRSERDWRIGATQMAAPSTRRWRRAGRFGA
jgi:hypothetical protein